MITTTAMTRTEKVRAAGDLLDQHVKELAEQMRRGQSEALVRYLEFTARFHQYSFRNLMLILIQRPTASRVAGLRQWNRLGRQVCAGEKGIMIMAPMAVWKRGDSGSEPASEDEIIESERSETRDKITIFKPVYVWDEAQTCGESLPELETAKGDVAACLPALRDAVIQMGIKLEVQAVVAKSSGTYGTSYGGRIVIKQGMSEAETFAVLAHELSHELLHWGKEGERKRAGKTIEEVEADATAFVVCRHFGVEYNSSDYLLLHNAKPEILLERLETVRTTAARIIEAIHEAMQEAVVAESV